MRRHELVGMLVVLASFATSSLPAYAQNAEQAIRSQLDVFEQAFNSGDGAKVGALYTENAIAFPPGSPRVEGRQAISSMWQGAINSGLKDLNLEAVEVTSAGNNTAYEVGRVTLKRSSGPAEGKYIVIWQRGDDGVWQLHRDIWNMNSQ